MSFAELCYEMIFIDQLVLYTHTHTFARPSSYIHTHTYIHTFNIDQSIQPIGRKEKKMLQKCQKRLEDLMYL